MRVLLVLALFAAGCGREPTRDPNVDANGPVVNPSAPGAKAGAKSAAPMGTVYSAPPGAKTGIPK
ncbi:MAG TPA: hypothetical protein VKT78_05835 [Fimbriimonadaceae bacterium]|nr:hypothetical protein [Fimbriimonadaceae bacterium]